MNAADPAFVARPPGWTAEHEQRWRVIYPRLLKTEGPFVDNSNDPGGATKYGVFYADESGDAGRSFAAVRLVRDFATQNLGVMMTHVDHPYLDREATVLGVDHNWRPNQAWNIQSRLFGSDIRQDGQATRDLGATVWADYDMGGGWRQQWIGMHFGNRLQINDAGYLDRNSINYGHWEVQRRFTEVVDGLLAEDEPVLGTMRFRRGTLVASDRHLARYFRYASEFPRAVPPDC